LRFPGLNATFGGLAAHGLQVSVQLE
jgi:hypothetical protein